MCCIDLSEFSRILSNTTVTITLATVLRFIYNFTLSKSQEKLAIWTRI